MKTYKIISVVEIENTSPPLQFENEAEARKHFKECTEYRPRVNITGKPLNWRIKKVVEVENDD